jgi:serine/threonine-protein kinase HipA
MPLANARAPFVFTDLPELTFKRLPGMIADALPDDFGNALIDAWMAGKGIDRLDITALDRLAYMGRRGTGALEFRPVIGPEVKRSTAIKLSRLVESARRAVQGDIGSDNTAKAALQQIIQVGTSAGGARAKAAIAWNPKTDEIRSGQFDVEPGFEHWILKFDGVGADRELGGSRNYGRIEYAYYLMARRAGISISPCRLMEENGRAHFMTRRFDRDGNARHHMQTLCAMKHLDFKQKATHDYSQFFMAIEQLQLGHAALEEAFRRVAFNVMAANCDDHTKNFSFILRQGGSWELAPAYDITHAYNPKGEWTYQHLMAVNGKFSDIRLEDFLLVAERFMIGNPKKILGQVQEAVEAWPEFAAEAGISEGDIGRVHGHHQPLLSAKIL